MTEGPIDGPHGPQRMKPLFDRATEGRANPRGIPVLYLAEDADTVVAELRPWPGQYVTLALFRTVRPVRVVDCSVDTDRSYLKEPRAPLREKAVWGAINESFCRPVSSDDRSADYAPTQTLAELFRENGFQGLVYRSSCTPGRNVVLFNQLLADPIRCTLCVVNTVSYGWSWAGAVENHES